MPGPAPYGSDAEGNPFKSEDAARRYVEYLKRMGYPGGHDPVHGVADPSNAESWAGLPYNPNNPSDPRNAPGYTPPSGAYPQWSAEQAEALQRMQERSAQDVVRRFKASSTPGRPYMFSGSSPATEEALQRKLAESTQQWFPQLQPQGMQKPAAAPPPAPSKKRGTTFEEMMLMNQGAIDYMAGSQAPEMKEALIRNLRDKPKAVK